MKISQKIAITIAFMIPASFLVYMVISIVGLFTYERHYRFEMVNNTPYQLDSIYVTVASDRNFTLAPDETSEEFGVVQGPFSDFFAENQLSVFVLQYTTDGSRHKNSLANGIGFSALRENKLNRIVIELREPQPTDTSNYFISRVEAPRNEPVAEQKRHGLFAKLLDRGSE